MPLRPSDQSFLPNDFELCVTPFKHEFACAANSREVFDAVHPLFPSRDILPPAFVPEHERIGQ